MISKCGNGNPARRMLVIQIAKRLVPRLPATYHIFDKENSMMVELCRAKLQKKSHDEMGPCTLVTSKELFLSHYC